MLARLVTFVRTTRARVALFMPRRGDENRSLPGPARKVREAAMRTGFPLLKIAREDVERTSRWMTMIRNARVPTDRR